MIVSVIDYGLSNLLSVCRAVETLGHEPVLTRTASEVQKANILILPGVGAFSDGMDGLVARDMLEPIRSRVQNGVPILGICLGMQMLFDFSHEFGVHKGMGLISGCVKRIQEQATDGRKLRVPHVGWEGLFPACEEQSSFASPILQNIQPGNEVYFIHSYIPYPEQKEHILAECTYGGHRLCAATGKDMVFGTQFHPEKSGPVGLKILDAFLRLV